MISLHGMRGEHNIDEALYLLKQIEEMPGVIEPRALFIRGELYEKGIGSRVDREKALEYYMKAV
jgi:TPR repeat protein